MPVYSFKCPACGEKKEVVRPMSEADLPVLCDSDAFVMVRDYFSDFGKQRVADVWPLVSTAAGVHPDQIDEMKKIDAANGLGGTQYMPDGDVVFTSRQHRKKYCHVHGLYDRNASYGDPAPINR